MAKVQISENRLKALLAAEAYCQATRRDIADRGGITIQTLAWFDQWMRRSGKEKFVEPKKVSVAWCGSCMRRHPYGQHD